MIIILPGLVQGPRSKPDFIFLFSVFGILLSVLGILFSVILLSLSTGDTRTDTGVLVVFGECTGVRAGDRTGERTN